MVRDWWRRIVRAVFPPADPHAIAALDGGPGAEPGRTAPEMRTELIARLARTMDLPPAFLDAEPAQQWATGGIVRAGTVDISEGGCQMPLAGMRLVRLPVTPDEERAAWGPRRACCHQSR